MENVLDIYQSPYDELKPWICFDESCKQLVQETREIIPAKPGQKKRYDYQYQRNGVANLLMFFEPLTGWRHVEVTDQRTAIDLRRGCGTSTWRPPNTQRSRRNSL
jgi:hypothetical protein